MASVGNAVFDPSAAIASGGIAHPSALHTQSELSEIAAHIAAGAAPWTAGWARLVANARSSAAFTGAGALAVADRGGSVNNYGRVYVAAASAYQNALRWRIAKTEANGAKAAAILNDWSSTLTAITGSADRFLLAGLQGAQFANAAELIRDRSDFNKAACDRMLLEVFYPLNNSFLTNHNGAYITNYWSSWDILTMNSIMAIGIVTDRPDLIDQSTNYFRAGAGNGAILNATQPTAIDDDVSGPQTLIQWNEAGRDQGHTLLGIGLMGEFCELAWHQGIDLYGYDDNRFLKAAQYVAKYNLGFDVPYQSYNWRKGAPGVWGGWETFTAAGAIARGNARPIWERIYGHYHGRLGLDATWVGRIAATVRAEGGGGDYGVNSGGYDQLGFGTLAAYRVAPASPTASPSASPSSAQSSASASPSTSSASGAPLAGPTGSSSPVPSQHAVISQAAAPTTRPSSNGSSRVPTAGTVGRIGLTPVGSNNSWFTGTLTGTVLAAGGGAAAAAIAWFRRRRREPSAPERDDLDEAVTATAPR